MLSASITIRATFRPTSRRCWSWPTGPASRGGARRRGGTAWWMAADKVVAKGRRLAAHLLEAAEADIEFAVGDAGGNFAVAGTDRQIALSEVAKAAFQPGRLPPGFEGGLFETGTYAPK